MRLFSGPSTHFIELTQKNQIAGYLTNEYTRQMGGRPSPSEVASWENSLVRLTVAFERAKLFDHGVMLEYRLPNNSQRLDCLICGNDEKRDAQAVIVELKQWSKCRLSDLDSEKVVTWVAGGVRDIPHPSVQVGGYKEYLQHNHTVFHEGESVVGLSACSYLHNYHSESSDPILDKRFANYLKTYPLFSADQTDELHGYLESRLRGGNGMPILDRIERSRPRPSKELMDHVKSVIRAKLREGIPAIGTDYILLDEQITAYDTVMSLVRNGFYNRKKYAIIIKGGPGTGKSVIALKLLADLHGDHFNAQYATGSQSFTQTLRKIVGTRAATRFKYFMSYGDSKPNEVDVLIMDEAHRIRNRTKLMFGKASKQSQIEELLNASKVSVFLLDEHQIVRPDEIGSVNYIVSAAAKSGCEVREYELNGQFRCGGSDAYVAWVNEVLSVKGNDGVLPGIPNDFDFKIFPTVEVLDSAIAGKVREGRSARMTAGYCWEWSDPDSAGRLTDDVSIGTFRRPWNAKPPAMRKINKNVPLADGVPESPLWAYDPKGMGQVGCIYTAQGFEFEYVGVIFGNDLQYNSSLGAWEAHIEKFADPMVRRLLGRNAEPEKLLPIVKNIYRVLLTRGLKGCYVAFLDKGTEAFFTDQVLEYRKPG